MKTLSKLFMACFLSMGLAACSSDDDPMGGGDNQVNSGDKVYMQFKIEMPTTRSATDDGPGGQDGESNSNANPDVEEGSNQENTVQDVQLVLVEESGKVVAKSITSTIPQNSQVGDKFLVSFRQNDLIKYAGKTVKVIAYCNTTSTNTKENVTFDLNEKSDKTNPEKIWAKSTTLGNNAGFWMTNANTTNLTTKLGENAADLATHKEGNPLILNPIEVERVAARFDFAAKAPDNMTYTITKSGYQIGNKTVDVKIQLKQLALFNMSKECYKLRRTTSDLGNYVASWDNIFGVETPSNYMVDTDWDAKKAIGDTYTPSDFFKFINETGETGQSLEWTNITDLKADDNWQDASDDPNKSDYYFWRYATENTFPGDAALEIASTGVAFRGIIIPPTESNDLTTDMTTTKPIYVYDNVLYGGWSRVRKAANSKSGGSLTNPSLKVIYDKIMDQASDPLKAKKDTEDLFTEDELTKEIPDLVEKLKDPGFKVFKWNSDLVGYPVYYNYYNRHNDPGLDSNGSEQDGPMKYAVVRNNVYKLRVDKISQFGDPKFDEPENITIDDNNLYFKVTVSIKKWIVRKNNIEF